MNTEAINLDTLVLKSGSHAVERAVAKLRALTDRAESGECWQWRGFANPNGYGWVNSGPIKVGAHRLALLVAGGEVPAGHDVCHRCDNRLCVNPEHLYAGTRAQNMKDCSARGRHNKPRGERHWRAKLTADDVAQIRRLVASGQRQADVARRFAINSATVSRIARREWRQEVA